jgi:aspartate aminotransferase
VYAERVKSAALSEIRIMMAAAPPHAINLGLGRPDFQPPKHLLDSLKKVVDDGLNHYGPTLGIKELREALVDKLKDRQPDITLDNIIITVGATGGLMTAMQIFVNHVDEVLIPNPGFVLHEPQIAFCGGKAVHYPLTEENEFRPDIDKMQELINPKTKVIIVNTPSNPTGSIYTEEDVKAIVDIAREKDLILISDEVYDDIVYEEKHNSFLGKYEKLIYVNSFSKTYAMTGWRIGFMVADPEVVQIVRKIQYCSLACPPTPLQFALVSTLKGSQDFVRDMVKEFWTRRDYVVNELNTIKGFYCVKPKGAFYAFPSFDFKMTSKELAMKILEKGVICTPGGAFGSNGDRHLRISYANTRENLKKGMEIIREATKGL